jgi:hypothetical protein
MTMLKDDGLKFWQGVRAAVLADTTCDAEERKAALATAEERIVFHTKAASNVVQLPTAGRKPDANVLARWRQRAAHAHAHYARTFERVTGRKPPGTASDGRHESPMLALALAGKIRGPIGVPPSPELRELLGEIRAEDKTLVEKCLASVRRVFGNA